MDTSPLPLFFSFHFFPFLPFHHDHHTALPTTNPTRRLEDPVRCLQNAPHVSLRSCLPHYPVKYPLQYLQHFLVWILPSGQAYYHQWLPTDYLVSYHLSHLRNNLLIYLRPDHPGSQASSPQPNPQGPPLLCQQILPHPRHHSLVNSALITLLRPRFHCLLSPVCQSWIVGWLVTLILHATTSVMPVAYRCARPIVHFSGTKLSKKLAQHFMHMTHLVHVNRHASQHRYIK